MRIDIELHSLDSEITITISEGVNALSFISLYYADISKGYVVDSNIRNTTINVHAFSLMQSFAVKCASYINEKRIDLSDAFYILLGVKTKL